MSAPAWKSNCSFLSPKPTESTVGGTAIKFYPVSVGLAFQLKDIAKPLAAGLAVLFTSERNDTGTIERTVADGREIIMEAIQPGLADARVRQRREAIQGIVEALTNETNKEVIGSIIIDSIYRDIWKTKDAAPPPAEFMGAEGISLENLGEFLVGVAKANKGIFGPLMTADIQARLESAIGSKLGPGTPANDQENPEKPNE